MERRGTGDEREDSGREWRQARGVGRGGGGGRGEEEGWLRKVVVVVRAGWLHEGKRGGARPVGRYFCACFVFNFSPPFARPRR